ncbi:hypothetical protein LTR13_006329 [Exophiala sideris]|nr:hypothetical protein LTR13_006329 [Exophiala sideris]
MTAQYYSTMIRYPASNFGDGLPYALNSNNTHEDSTSSTLSRRIRTGVLKTVGDPSLGNTSSPSEEHIKVEIPMVDFGTTITPTLTPGVRNRPATVGANDSCKGDKISPKPQSHSQDARTFYVNAQSGRPSSRAWQPVDTGRQSPVESLTAEQFVQQRAAAARIPQPYSSHRSVSYSRIERSPTKLEKKKDLPGRPVSRNSLIADFSSAKLSAREQEHIARVTGGPLIQVVERTQTPDPFVGLVGAIEVRQQEKRMVRQELAGYMAEQAMWQRQVAEWNYASQQYSGHGYAVAQSPISWTSSGFSSPLSGVQKPPMDWNSRSSSYNVVEVESITIPKAPFVCEGDYRA